MSGRAYRGLTWDHPRGYVALEKAAALASSQGLDLTWEAQPLEGFESHSIAELADRYDLIVLDHPHVGDAFDVGCLQSIEAIFSAKELAELQARSIGHTFASYRYGGMHWALPLDAASQVAACRHDRLDEAPPRTWSALPDFARRHPIVLSLAGPHAILTLFSMSAAHGDVPAATDPAKLFSGTGATSAWEMLRELHALAVKGWDERNPIAILEGLAHDAEAVYCPLVFGYVNYAVASVERHAVRFGDVPQGPAGRLGSVLGGTGLAVSRRTEVDAALRAHLSALVGAEMQRDFIPFAAGQPSARDAWCSDAVDQACGNFFANTRATVEVALVRPRFAGYVSFQAAAAALVRKALGERLGAVAVLAGLQALFEHHRPQDCEN